MCDNLSCQFPSIKVLFVQIKNPCVPIYVSGDFLCISNGIVKYKKYPQELDQDNELHKETKIIWFSFALTFFQLTQG